MIGHAQGGNKSLHNFSQIALGERGMLELAVFLTAFDNAADKGAHFFVILRAFGAGASLNPICKHQ
jgi:hypothetical protein